MAEAAAGLAGSAVVAVVRGIPVSDVGMVVKVDHRIAIYDIGHKLGHWPRHGCCGRSVVQSVPGHGAVLPVGFGRCGGALG